MEQGTRLSRRTLLKGAGATTAFVVTGGLGAARRSRAQEGASRAAAGSAAADTLDPQRIRFVEVDGIRTRYYEAGAGEPLVLVHGGQFGPGYSLDSWSMNLHVLARSFHVYALDRLGQGHTDNPKSDDAYTFEALFQHFRGFLEAVGVRGAHFVGHSRGGLPIARLALEHPQLVRTLVIVDSSTLAPEDPQFPSGAFYGDIARRMPPGPPTREAVRLEPAAQSYSTRHVGDDFVGRLLEIALLPKTQEAQRRMAALGERVWTPSLNRARADALRMIDQHGLPVPTLVIWAFNDVSAPMGVHGLPLFQRIAAKTPHSEFHVLNQSGHYVFREQPTAFNRLVQSFCLG